MLNPIKIRSAELNKRVTIQRAVQTTNDRGVILYTYPDYRAVHGVCASIEPFGSRIVDGVAEKIAEVEFRITIRYRNDITPRDRIVYQGRVFAQSLPAIDINEQHQFLQLTCKEVVINDGKV